jgi:pimeloyl-ACP methyl ester carboxylesterase
MGTHKVRVDGGQLLVTVRGAGDSAILVHGGLSDARTWHAQVRALGRGRRVITYDRRDDHPRWGLLGTGPDHLGRDVDDLAALVASRGLGAVDLVGHSWGALVCLWLAIRRPDLVRSLVLAEPPLLPIFVSNPPRPQELIRLFAISPAAMTAFVKFGVRGLGSTISRRRLRPELLATGLGPLSDEQLGEVEVTVLLVTGASSPAFLTGLSDRLETTLPQSRHVTIDQASHFMHEDNPDAFNRAVLEFWALLPGRKAA